MWLLLATACSDNEATQQKVETEEITYKVAVVMPSTSNIQWKRTAAWALENLKTAQSGLSRRINLELEWQDETASDRTEYLSRVADDDSYAAIIGPFTSYHAQEAASLCAKSKKCLILPIATSTEFQRIHAGKGYVWNLSQSDITQCEILLTQAKLSDISEVSLLTTEGTYGKSFSDWFAYQAVELGMKVGEVIVYQTEQELREAIQRQEGTNRWYDKALIFAPDNEADAILFDEEYGKLTEGKSWVKFPLLLCSDIMNSSMLASKLKNLYYEGTSPCADPQSGFHEAYKVRFGEEPVNGEAHFYDAFILLSYALAAKQDAESVNEAMLRVVDGRTSYNGSWLPHDMRNAFSMLQNGMTPDLSGVIGDWTFDERTHASVLNTIYNHWKLIDGQYHTIEYLSTDGGSRTTSTMQAWEWSNNYIQTFDPDQKDLIYPTLKERWAVVIGTSDDWTNYRHQADALAMYQLLKRHGYDDAHIILIIADNLANDSRNIYPGEVRVRPDGENVYKDVKVDYHLNELSLADLKDVMTGHLTPSLQEVIRPTGNDNVIVFWCGHGNYNRLAWGSTATVTGEDVHDWLAYLQANQSYRKLLFSMDACYSGSIAEACIGLPGVLFITAANADEPSKADMRDDEMGIWLSNGFTRAFQETIDNEPDISLRNLYQALARSTVGSHATIYNIENYGNLYKLSMGEYLK